MKILHTESSLGFGGQELRTLNEMEGFQARGDEVVLISPPEAEIFSIAKQRGLNAVALPIGRKNLKGLFAMRRWLQANSVDVINTHSSTDSWLCGVATKTLRNAAPVVRTRHISAPVPQNASSRWLYTKAARHIVTTGEKLRLQLIQENDFPQDQITSIRTGVDLTVFHPTDNKPAIRQKLGIDVSALVIGIVATLRSWKGHRYLIEAFEQLEGTELTLLIVGDGPQDAALRELVEKKGLTDRVTFTGRQNNVAEWMQAIDIFCLPSYANEGVPQALMQSQACGIPAITTDVGSICEAVVADKSAFIVEIQNSAEIRERLIQMIADPALRAAMGQAAAEHAKEAFSREIMLDQMTQIFEKICAENR